MRSNISSHAEAKAFYIGLSVEGFANNLFCPTGPRTVHLGSLKVEGVALKFFREFPKYFYYLMYLVEF